MDLRQVFAANLRRLRHARGLSQEDLAYEADVNRSYMSTPERGGSYPGLEIIGKARGGAWGRARRIAKRDLAVKA
jgi:transcriptional regulator with XRE-family HTH domain